MPTPAGHDLRGTAAWALLASALAGIVLLAAVIGTDALAATASQPSAVSAWPIVTPALPITFGTTLLGASIAAFATLERHLSRYFKERG